MGTFRADHVRRLLCCITSIHAHGDLDDFPARTLRAIMELLSADCAGYNEISLRPQKLLRSAFLGDTYTSGQLQAFERHIHEHPLIDYTYRHPGCRALRISDFLTRKKFHDIGLYNEFFKQVGVEHQLAVAIASQPGMVVGIALNRRRGDFSETQRAMLDLLQPHIQQAHRTAQLIAKLRRQSEQAGETLERSGIGSITARLDGRIESASAEARRLLEAYYPAGNQPGNRLPSQLGDYLHRAAETLAGGCDPCLPLVEYRSARWLIVRMSPGRDDTVLLLLREHSVAGYALQLQALDLTPRQAEVMAWLAQGKTDLEIGCLLKVSPRTVEKHVENILHTLGLESRIAAVVLAFDVIG